jgi:hypothetical protein
MTLAKSVSLLSGLLFHRGLILLKALLQKKPLPGETISRGRGLS